MERIAWTRVRDGNKDYSLTLSRYILRLNAAPSQTYQTGLTMKPASSAGTTIARLLASRMSSLPK